MENILGKYEKLRLRVEVRGLFSTGGEMLQLADLSTAGWLPDRVTHCLHDPKVRLSHWE